MGLALREDKAAFKGPEEGEGEDEEEVQEEQAIADLRWFLSELSKDMKSMQPEPVADKLVPRTKASACAKAPSGKAAGPAPPDLEDLVASTVELLRSDPGCKTAAYHPSKTQFYVVRKEDNTSKKFRVLRLKRKREAAAHSDSRDLQDAFDSIVQQAKVWMASDAVPADGPAEDCDEEDKGDQEDKMAGEDDPDPLTQEPADDSDEEASD